MPTPRLSATARDRIAGMIRGGKHTWRQIAKACRVSVGSVANVAEDIGLGGKKKRTTEATRKKVHAEIRKGGSFRQVADRAGVSEATVASHAKRPPPDQSPAEFPPSQTRDAVPFVIDTPGRWLVLSDIHVPCHDRTAIELAVAHAKRDGVAGVLLNGDTLDSHEISDHDKDPSAPRYVREVELGAQFLRWVRGQFPAARLVYKEGNHEERLARYVYGRAPALFGLTAVTLRGLLEMDAVGAEVVGDKRVVRMGKLNVIHGHEYRGGGGVNPARWIYLKARSVAMCGHFHRPSEHHAKDISGKHEAAWSTGCLCDLHPLYAPLNEWSHGYAMVEIDSGGGFTVRNMRVLNGKVV